MRLNCQDLSDQMLSVTKTRQDNDMTDCISVVYMETKTKLSRFIELGVICYQNQTGQHNGPYRCGLYQKQNSIVVIDRIGCPLWQKLNRAMMWPLIQVRLHWKWKWVVVIDRIGCNIWWKLDRTTIWPIIKEWSTSKMKQNYRERLDQVLTMTKTK